MAAITNVHLALKGEGKSKEATVSYTIHFSQCEVGGLWTWHEQIFLRGPGAQWDSNEVIIHQGCIKAQKESSEQKVNKLLLFPGSEHNEQGVWVNLPFLNSVDSVYAHVILTPFVPQETDAFSNIQTV